MEFKNKKINVMEDGVFIGREWHQGYLDGTNISAVAKNQFLGNKKSIFPDL